MIGGLFLNTLSFIVTNQHVVVNNTPHVNTIVQQHHVASANIPIKSFHLEFSIAVLFVLFLALYRSTNFKMCVGVLMFKIVSMTLIGPMLITFGYYIDGIVTTTVLAL
uniref:Truncated non-structural protein 3c n=1 Tax=Feline coronavirus TaxID=12663 RepID=A0A2Z6FAE8_9ALPC|nr:truncated non-structural protein 3c [Feline coronavirus]